ncbi:MAG: fumarate reductase cytochrome b subunit [Pseudomonadota bacterium]
MESLLQDTIQKSRLPARLDVGQSITGLILGVFMWIHMLLVASILLGKGSFSFVARMMEASFLSSSGHGYPILVFFAVSVIFSLFIVHAALGVRKIPISFRQYQILSSHIGMTRHGDTILWAIQAVTGFLMFFLGSVHLYMMWSNPGSIDPYLSADRVYTHSLWALYLPLLVCVELHGTIGLYRLALKWGWFMGKDPRKTRKVLKAAKIKVTAGFLGVGFMALIIFLTIGFFHRDDVGQRYYQPGTHALQTIDPHQAPAPASGHNPEHETN